MPLNSAGYSFIPLGNAFAVPPTITGDRTYRNLSTAQCNGLSALTSVSVTTAGVTVNAATARTTGITIVVPTDQQAVTFSNNTVTASGVSAAGIPEAPMAAPVIPPFDIPAGTPANNQTTAVITTGVTNGLVVPPGGSYYLAPYTDPMYAVVPAGTATVFYVNT